MIKHDSTATSVSAKSSEREKIAKQVKDFMDKGGKIQKLDSELIYGRYKPVFATGNNEKIL